MKKTPRVLKPKFIKNWPFCDRPILVTLHDIDAQWPYLPLNVTTWNIINFNWLIRQLIIEPFNSKSLHCLPADHKVEIAFDLVILFWTRPADLVEVGPHLCRPCLHFTAFEILPGFALKHDFTLKNYTYIKTLTVANFKYLTKALYIVTSWAILLVEWLAGSLDISPLATFAGSIWVPLLVTSSHQCHDVGQPLVHPASLPMNIWWHPYRLCKDPI